MASWKAYYDKMKHWHFQWSILDTVGLILTSIESWVLFGYVSAVLFFGCVYIFGFMILQNTFLEKLYRKITPKEEPVDKESEDNPN